MARPPSATKAQVKAARRLHDTIEEAETVPDTEKALAAAIHAYHKGEITRRQVNILREASTTHVLAVERGLWWSRRTVVDGAVNVAIWRTEAEVVAWARTCSDLLGTESNPPRSVPTEMCAAEGLVGWTLSRLTKPFGALTVVGKERFDKIYIERRADD